MCSVLRDPADLQDKMWGNMAFVYQKLDNQKKMAQTNYGILEMGS